MLIFGCIIYIILSCDKNDESKCVPIEFFSNGSPMTMACRAGDLIFYKHFNESQVLEMTYYLDDSSRYQGKFTYFNNDGSVYRVGFYKDDKMHGWFTNYDDSGNIYSKSFYRDDSIFFKVQYGEKDPYRVFRAKMRLKQVNLFEDQLDIQAELIFPLEDTSINLDNVVYAVGLKRFDERRDTILNGLKDIFIPVEKENFPKTVDLSFRWEKTPYLYYYIMDTTEFEVYGPSVIDLSEYLIR